jgi:hypothetical protein
VLILIRSFLLLIAIFALTGCDKHLFNEIFRNPHIVEIAELDSLKANQWYTFQTDIKVLNKNQVIRIDFLGSAPEELALEIIDYDINSGEGGRSQFHSKRFPNKEILFNVKASDTTGTEYMFYPGGHSSGIRYHNKHDINMREKLINSIKIKSDIDHKNIKLTWISSTGK